MGDVITCSKDIINFLNKYVNMYYKLNSKMDYKNDINLNVSIYDSFEMHIYVIIDYILEDSATDLIVPVLKFESFAHSKADFTNAEFLVYICQLLEGLVCLYEDRTDIDLKNPDPQVLNYRNMLIKNSRNCCE